MLTKRLYAGFVILVSLISSSVESAPSHPPDIQRILNKKELRIGIYGTIPPFISKDETGKWVGADIRIGEDIAERLGVKPRFDGSAKTYNELIDMLVAKKIDIALSISATLPRASKISFTQPYRTNSKSLWMNRLNLSRLKAESNPLKKLNQPNATAGNLVDSAYAELTHQAFPQARHRDYKTMDELFDAIREGQVDFGISADYLGKNYLKRHTDASMKLQSKTYSEWETPIRIGVHWQDQNLLDWLNLYIETIKADGTWEEIKKTHLKP